MLDQPLAVRAGADDRDIAREPARMLPASYLVAEKKRAWRTGRRSRSRTTSATQRRDVATSETLTRKPRGQKPDHHQHPAAEQARGLADTGP